MTTKRTGKAPYLRSRSTGAGFAFCGVIHLNSWLKFRNGHLDDYLLSGLPRGTCAYCYVCGKRVTRRHCRLHDTTCPEYDDLYRFGPTAVTPLVYNALNRPLTDDDFQHIHSSIADHTIDETIPDISQRALRRIRATSGECDNST